MKITIYIIAIILANVLTSSFAPMPMFGLLVPQGTLLIGFTFVMRDLVQMHYGRQKTYFIISVALILSAASTYLMGNGVHIVIASALSFMVSEVMDTEIFTRWKGKFAGRVLVSGTVGSILDSAVFTFAAGFPVQAMFGQMIVKVVFQILAAAVIVRSSSLAEGGRRTRSNARKASESHTGITK